MKKNTVISAEGQYNIGAFKYVRVFNFFLQCETAGSNEYKTMSYTCIITN